MNEPTAATVENKIGKTIFFIGKSETWYRFEKTGETEITIESFWFDDIKKTEKVSVTGARKIWKMLLDDGFVDETNGRDAARDARKSATATESKFGKPLTAATGPSAEDAERENRAIELENERRAKVAAHGRRTCPKCHGTGKFAGISTRKCFRCRGTGEVAVDIRNPHK